MAASRSPRRASAQASWARVWGTLQPITLAEDGQGLLVQLAGPFEVAADAGDAAQLVVEVAEPAVLAGPADELGHLGVQDGRPGVVAPERDQAAEPGERGQHHPQRPGVAPGGQRGLVGGLGPGEVAAGLGELGQAELGLGQPPGVVELLEPRHRPLARLLGPFGHPAVVGLEREPGPLGVGLAPGIAELPEGGVGLVGQAGDGLAGTAPLELGVGQQELGERRPRPVPEPFEQLLAAPGRVHGRRCRGERHLAASPTPGAPWPGGGSAAARRPGRAHRPSAGGPRWCGSSTRTRPGRRPGAGRSPRRGRPPSGPAPPAGCRSRRRPAAARAGPCGGRRPARPAPGTRRCGGRPASRTRRPRPAARPRRPAASPAW